MCYSPSSRLLCQSKTNGTQSVGACDNFGGFTGHKIDLLRPLLPLLVYSRAPLNVFSNIYLFIYLFTIIVIRHCVFSPSAFLSYFFCKKSRYILTQRVSQTLAKAYARLYCELNSTATTAAVAATTTVAAAAAVAVVPVL